MKHIRLLLILILIAPLLPCAESESAQQHFAKLGVSLPAGHPALAPLKQFQFHLSEQLTIQIFPGAQLGSAQQIMEGLQFGDIEMGILPLESISRYTPALNMIVLPYFFRDDTHRAQVLDGPLGKQLLDELDGLGLIGLGFLETGPRLYVSRDRALNAREDFQGRAVALPCSLPANECEGQSYELSVRSLNIIGANGTLVPLAALGDVLKTEKPDIVEYLPFTGMEHQLNENGLTTLMLPLHRTVPTVLVAGKRWFDTLPPQARKAIAGAANTLVRQQRGAIKNALEHEYVMLEAQGIKIITRKHEELQQAMQTLYEENADEFGPGFGRFLRTAQQVGRTLK